MAEYLHDLKPPRSTMEIIISVLSKLDNEPFNSPEDRARRFAALYLDWSPEFTAMMPA